MGGSRDSQVLSAWGVVRPARQLGGGRYRNSAIPARAADVTSLTSCQSITAPGTYRLDADVISDVGVCFRIGANNVTLILDGHTITSVGGEAGIETVGSGSTILGPGTVSGWGVGIDLLGDSGSVRGVTATGNDADIFIGSAGNDVRGNVTTDNGVGLEAAKGTGVNTIIGNFAHNNAMFDLGDQNLNCDGDVWLGNDFGTSVPPRPSCIH